MKDVFSTIGSPLTLRQEIVHKIERAILEKKIQPGEKLPTEKEFCQMFGVSRTALREALQSLSAKGLIRIKKGSGTYVNDFSTVNASENMSLFLEMNFDKYYAMHIVQTRQILEPEIAALAAANRAPEHLADLEENLADFGDESASVEQHAKLDLEFHLAIAEACGNPVMRLVMDPLYGIMPRIKALVVARVKHNKVYSALDEHTLIYEMIRAGDPDGARDAMATHLKSAERDVRALIDSLVAEEDPS